eukprot:TRINITY_DN26656_c0_g10_i1.p1 TRINITY_DN26656_c0_g10~~TRINITY_DN26656_c0_g10_i1.p1  ORF type:complete len:915 (+),score=199.31 TRINITY_DN26656_c0_g10_i1:204-2948(+)
MGGGSSKVDSDEGTSKFAKGTDKDLSDGPLKNRSCTDILCMVLYVAHLIGFIVVVSMGFVGGDPARLMNPRDYAGNYCGVKVNWNNGPDMSGHGKMLMMMNVSSTVDPLMEQLLCSSQAEGILANLWSSDQAKLDTYRCDCCISPCLKCQGSGTKPVFGSASALTSSIGGKMGDLTNPANAKSLWSYGVSDIMAQVDKYFVRACVASCGDVAAPATRNFTYMPAPDSPFYEVWKTLRDSTKTGVPGLTVFQDTMKAAFGFKALPKNKCPYDDARYCVPFPGLEFMEAGMGHCTFQLNSQVMAMVGSAFNGVAAAADQAGETLGSAMGDIIESMDTLGVVAVVAFCIGFVFLVLLRFFVGVVVWLAVLFTLILFACAGLAAYIRSFQCAESSFTSSVVTFGVAVGSAAENAASNAISGAAASDESLVGNGETYVGIQSRTRHGRDCQDWSASSPHSHSMLTKYPNANLTKNYCRNPGGEVTTIWCFTTDPETRWDLCKPIGDLGMSCPNGYVVESPEFRYALEICAYIIWGIGGIFLLCICFLSHRIRLAIALNKASAQFIMAHVLVVMIPVGQAIVGIIWLLVWALCAAYLFSKVPDGVVPTESYATYAEAFGTSTVPGKCTGAWPTGEVYRSYGDMTSTNDPCSGNLGVAPAVPKCWKCAPPRYAIDAYSAYAFFSLLWNNAFLIAVGQMLVAGACGVWFFTPRSNKGKSPAIKTSFKNTFFYHLGTVAFGSFILAVVQFIRYTLKYFEKQAEAQKNKVMALVLKCLQCCIWCFEKCIKFLNKNAYIQTALLGTSFCTSAKNAFQLIARNFIRFGVVTSLAGMVGSLGVFFIMVVTAVLGYFIQIGMHPDITPVVPVLLYICVGYVVAKLFMNVFNLAVSTMLQCVIATEEMGGGDFVPQALVKVIDATPKQA